MYMRSGSLIDVNTDRGSPPLAVYNAPMITEVCAGSCAEAKRKVRATARGVPPPPSTWLSTCVSSSHVNGGGALTVMVTSSRASLPVNDTNSLTVTDSPCQPCWSNPSSRPLGAWARRMRRSVGSLLLSAYGEEDTCHMGRRIPVGSLLLSAVASRMTVRRRRCSSSMLS